MLGSSVGVLLLTGTWSAVAFCPVGASDCLDPEGGGARALATGDGADALLDSDGGARALALGAAERATRLALLEWLDRRAERIPREGAREERIGAPRERIGAAERIFGAENIFEFEGAAQNSMSMSMAPPYAPIRSSSPSELSSLSESSDSEDEGGRWPI